MTENLHGAREIVVQRLLEILAPARRARWKPAGGKPDGGEIKTRVETAATVDAELFGIHFIKIVKDAADGKSFVIVERFVKHSISNRGGIGHEIFADKAAGVRKAVGKLIRRGKQEQSRSLGAIGTDDHGLSPLQVLVLLGVKVDDPGGFSVFVYAILWT